MSDVAGRVVEVLSRRQPHARFVPELSRQLRVEPGELETALIELEASGRALVREQYCPDPHLEGSDLRIVALVDAAHGDAVAAAVDSIDRVWQRWLGEYLANHRCT
jgi:hypothetical protein